MIKWLSLVFILELCGCNASQMMPQASSVQSVARLSPQVVQGYGEHLWVDFPDKYASGSLGQIAADKNGNVYYADANFDGSIDKLDYSGTVTSYRVGFNNEGPGFGPVMNTPGVAVGNDGNIWYTGAACCPPPPSQAAYYLSSITPNGAATSHGFTTYLDNGNPIYGQLVAGAASTIWDVDYALHRYDYSTNTLTTFNVPGGPIESHSITKASDGSIWFTGFASGGDAVYKANPSSGAIRTYKLAVPEDGIVGGDNGSVLTVGANCTASQITSSGTVIGRATFGLTGCETQPVFAQGTLWVVANEQSSPCQTSSMYLIQWHVSAVGKPVSKTLVPAGIWAPPPCASGQTTPGGLALGSDGNLYAPLQNGSVGVHIINSITVDPWVSLYTFTAPYKYLTLTVGETNYSGSWTAGSSQPSVVRVVKWLSRTQVQIESLGKGNGRIIIRDNKDNYYNFFVAVQ